MYLGFIWWIGTGPSEEQHSWEWEVQVKSEALHGHLVNWVLLYLPSMQKGDPEMTSSKERCWKSTPLSMAFCKAAKYPLAIVRVSISERFGSTDLWGLSIRTFPTCSILVLHRQTRGFWTSFSGTCSFVLAEPGLLGGENLRANTNPWGGRKHLSPQ